MVRNRSRLLKTQHFAEEGSRARHVNPLRASSLRTALELQTQNVGIAAGALPAFIVTRRLMASVLPREQTVR